MSEDRVLEMGDGKGNWWPIGTVGAIEDLGPVGVEPLKDQQPRVVIVGATASQRATLNGLSPGMIFIDEFADIDVKCLDMIDCQLSGSFIVSDEDQKKLVEMFDELKEGSKLTACELITPWPVRGDHRDQPKRGKKGKFKKDWQR